MPAVFDSSGLSFQYPDNWVLDESATDAGTTVTVESPGGAFWCVSVLPPGTEPEARAASALSAIEEEYNDVEFEAVEALLHGVLATGYDVELVYLDLTVTAWIRAFDLAGVSYLVHWQAEDRELQLIGPVFDAMLVSLIGSLDAEA